MEYFINIDTLFQVRSRDEKIIRGRKMNELPAIRNAWMAMKEGRIDDFGSMDDLDPERMEGLRTIDLTGRMVLPTWVDGHTHLVFADWRNHEFEDRIKGLSYQEIAARGGGILNSAQKLSDASEDQLFRDALERLNDLISKGTGAIEIKSGYGLSVESELKMLRVVKRLKGISPIPIKATFLGAHAFPKAYAANKDGYVDLIINEMLPRVSSDGLADYIDVFCEEGYFSLAQTERILDAGIAAGLKPKVHVNQFNALGAVKLCVEKGALSVDHLEELNDDDIQALQEGNTVAVGLPGCSFFLGIPYTPVRRLMEADIPVALATDFNPGSSPDGNMNFIFSLACIKMGMEPAEAVNAMTLNAAASIELQEELGSITKGKRANFIVTKPINALSYLPYAFAQQNVEQVFIEGVAFKA